MEIPVFSRLKSGISLDDKWLARRQAISEITYLAKSAIHPYILSIGCKVMF
jgi:hypothetical protein